MKRAAFTAGAATAALATTRRVAAQGQFALRVAAPANDTVTPALWAAHAGLFAKAGLNVDLRPMNSGAAVAAAVAGGALDIGLSSLITLITAHVRGVPFTLLAPSGIISTDVPFTGMIVRKEMAIASGRDLNGKAVSSPGLKDLNAVGLMAWVDAHGGDAQSLRFVELSQPASLAALAEGRIDATILGTPALTEALDSGKFRSLGPAFEAIASRFEHIAWFANTDFVERNRDAVGRFVRVIREANLYCNAHPADTVPLVAEFDKMEVAVVAKMVRVPFAEYLEPRLMQPLVDAAARYKVIERAFDAAELISPLALKPPR